jgi:CubicO group peptidase (beta-lactamase class C family)
MDAVRTIIAILTLACGLALLGLTAFPAAGQAPAQGPAFWQWPVSTPEEQGLDPKLLAEVVDLIRKGELLPRLHYLVVVRHGRLVLEENFHGWGPGKLHALQSVSKSFTSALVGIAIARGEFKGVDEKVLDFFPDMKGIADPRGKSGQYIYAARGRGGQYVVVPEYDSEES